MKQHDVRIVIVMLVTEDRGKSGNNPLYCAVKLEADSAGIETQCVKWFNVTRPPRGYHQNLMIKINAKMGGINHTLSSRLGKAPASGAGSFQDPPASISWLFDKLCMLVGIDVSHAEPGSDKDSLAAVVGTMNGSASQYVAHLSIQSARKEMVTVSHSFTDLLDMYMPS
jgi:eukaryotic translation initiation factor 2C